MQSFAHSLVILLHIAFNCDKVTMENHNNANDITSHRKLHLQTNAMLWWLGFIQTIIYPILIDKMN